MKRQIDVRFFALIALLLAVSLAGCTPHTTEATEVGERGGFPPELDLVGLFRQMWAIRHFDSQVIKLFMEGLIRGSTHAYIGMEAATSWSGLGRFDSAVTLYERSLAGWPDSLRRDQGREKHRQ